MPNFIARGEKKHWEWRTCHIPHITRVKDSNIAYHFLPVLNNSRWEEPYCLNLRYPKTRISLKNSSVFSEELHSLQYNYEKCAGVREYVFTRLKIWQDQYLFICKSFQPSSPGLFLIYFMLQNHNSKYKK